MMKNLLYIALIALFVSSCSVDSIQEENSFDLNTELRGKDDPVSFACNTANLIDSDGVVVGSIEAFEDTKSVVVTLTTYDWKIRNSKLYVGPALGSPENPGLFELGKYEYTESFENGVYVANYEFAKVNIKPDYCVMASLTLSNDTEMENGYSKGKPVPNSQDGLYLLEFFKNCL